uniref:Uncharacterized protein n=1 Tax=Romanomermis culicivorax TaxID=13658 RepID=A0A915L3L9_ROMCU
MREVSTAHSFRLCVQLYLGLKHKCLCLVDLKKTDESESSMASKIGPNLRLFERRLASSMFDIISSSTLPILTNRPNESHEECDIDENHSEQISSTANGSDIIVNPFSASNSRQDLHSTGSDGPAHKRSKGGVDGSHCQMDVGSPPKSH